ncbi:MAG TPA: hypothetical protein ENK44_08785 [Caldithrix abyssi]|uniref:DUF3307 domain-containing protein n=1 Tax=Caldithrix abyssi TaxID=187145 RepID=A0A7V4U1A5_CALAY|nr:hypothetical protein [Caldithrix abyssi]
MNHSETVWLYLLIYFSARLFFVNTRIFLSRRKPQVVFPIKRVLWGILAFLFIERLEAALLLFVLHGTVVSLEFLAFKIGRFRPRLQYTAQLVLALILIPAAITAWIPLLPSAANPIHSIFLNFVQAITYINPALQSNMAAVSTGFIFTLKEATIIIRFALQRIQAVPADEKQPGKRDVKEYERGRFIGNLERSLIYFLILFNQIGAIGIIIALKSLARFKKMDDKDFAEYFLIGSFLSIILAAIPAVVVKYMAG